MEANWIKCSEKMPEEYTDVLCCLRDEMYVDFVDNTGFFKIEFPIQPSHWMPLPSPPVDNIEVKYETVTGE